MKNAKVILASRSPRRASLLSQIAVSFDVAPADIDERQHDGESPHDYVRRMALEKAAAVAMSAVGAVVLGADTSVIVDGRVLGKPATQSDAAAMLRSLSGRAHEVLTGVAIQRDIKVVQTVTCTRVHMRQIDDHEMSAYWHSGEPSDKAGGYAIQGLGAQFVQRIEGSYSGVVGLPLCETVILLRQAGVACGLMSNVA